jgi:hypothetical protein
MSFLYAKYGKAVIAGEVVVLGATYYIYSKLTTEEAYRAKVHFGETDMFQLIGLTPRASVAH